MSDRDSIPARTAPPGEIVGAESAPTDETVGVRSLIDELKARVAEISAHELDLQRRENELEEKRRQLESARSAETIEQLRRIRRKLAVAKDELRKREAALIEREQAVIAPEVSSKGKADVDVRSELRRLKEMEAAIVQRRDDVDRLYQQASEVAAGAQRRNAESIRMREEIEARDVELRRLEVQLATERSEVARTAATHDTAQSDAAERQTPANAAGPPWLAAVGSSAAVFAVALAVQPTVYQATGRLVIDSQRDNATNVTIEHAAILGDPAQIRTRLPEDLATLWSDGLARGVASARTIPSPPAVELELRGENASEPSAALARIIGAYGRHVADVPADRWRFPRLEQWRERVDAAERRLAEASTSLAGVAAQLQSQAGYAEWESNRAALAQARAKFAAMTDEVRRLTGELATLVEGPPPRGTVGEDELAAALRSDPSYREDAKEFASEFRKYRVETAVAMVVATEPLGLLRVELQQLEQSLIEQRDLQPPQTVREQIEQTLGELGGVVSLTAAAVQGWEDRRERVERIDTAERSAELLKLQSESVEQANRLTGALRDFIAVVGKRLDQLSADGQGGTRALVVSSLIRGRLSALAERTDAVARAMSEVDASSNTRLDVADRQVRGLRTRMNEQRAAIEARLQEEADRRAADEHRQRIDGMKADLVAAESRRDEAARDLSGRLDLVDRLESSTRALRDLAADRDRLELTVCEAEEELSSLNAARPAAQPDLVRAASSNVVQIAGDSRWTIASILALVGGAVTLGTGAAVRRVHAMLHRGGRSPTG